MKEYLDLDRCPWCKTATPTLINLDIENYTKGGYVSTLTLADCAWRLYICSRCKKLVLAKYEITYKADQCATNFKIIEYIKNEVFPDDGSKSYDSIPPRITKLLKQAHDTLHSPDACLMVCASALDAMLQEKGLQGDTLNKRIDEAASKHLITEDMKKWAHQIRLEANDSRHPEQDKELATQKEAEQCLEFAMALAEILFVLPAKVSRGIEQSASQRSEATTEE